jgi:hypothetical protein
MKLPTITDEAVKKGVHQDHLTEPIDLIEARMADGNRILGEQPALSRFISEALGHYTPDQRQAFMMGMFLVVRALEEMPEPGLRVVGGTRSNPGRSSPW